MYNGIGLSTPRGSGTNGFVVRNMSSLRPQRREDRSFDDLKLKGPAIKQPNQEILLHDRKRQIEVECLKLRMVLEDDGENEDSIETKVSELRANLTAKLDTIKPKDAKSLHTHETHQLSEAKHHENQKMMKALGIPETGYVEGAAFDRELQEKLKQERIAQREADMAERETRRKQARSDPSRQSGSKRGRSPPARRHRSRTPERKQRKLSARRDSPSVSRSRSPSRSPSKSPIRGGERGRRASPPRGRRGRSRSVSSRSDYSSSRSRSRSYSDYSRSQSPVRRRSRSRSYSSRSRSYSSSRSRSPANRR